jgi:hypothetical protein
MLSVSDILKILDKTPIWKSLKDLPKRLEALEARVAQLETSPKQAEHMHTCAQCGAPAKVTNVRDHPTFGTFGVKERTVTCDNGHAQTFKWDPNKEP